MKDALLKALKTTYNGLGFDEKVFLGVAEALAATGLITDENLESAIAGAKPALTSFQAELDRRVNAQKAEFEKEKKKAAEKKGAGDPDPEPATPNPGKSDDEATKLLKMIAEQNKQFADRLAAIEGGKVADTRKQQITSMLSVVKDDAPQSLIDLKDSILEDFSMIKFESDEDFSTYLSGKESRVQKAIQAAANDGLGRTPKPITSSGGSSGNEASKQELDEVMQSLKV